MSIVVLAEKPGVARDLARVLGAVRKGDGFLEGNGYRVTWAVGHLVRFAEPDEYGVVQGTDWSGRWSARQLPMIPDRWELKTSPQTAAQFKRVQSLITAPDTERLICATDAGREGEHIFRLIYEHARCRKPFDRLWVSSLTDEAIREGFRALRPGKFYDHLADAARARAQADWLIGMNLTRAYTLHNRVLCTIGRVQTPTLAMIVARDRSITRFTKTFFYELVASLRTADGAAFQARYLRDGETRIDAKEEAERVHRELSPHRTGRVTKVEQRIRIVRPPPLHDLTNLQRDANRRFGFTAAQVLEHAQALYETHKLISYPRTESRHLSEDMLPELPTILNGLDHPLAAEASARLRAGHRLGKAYVDRAKLTDHHAILPTGRTASPDLPAPLRRIYDLVVERFVGIFLPDQRIEDTRAEIVIGDGTFLARGARLLDPGWKRVEGRAGANGPGEDGPAAFAEAGAVEQPGEPAMLPGLEPGQEVAVDRLEIEEKTTQPPRHYDDATLLAAMKNAGRELEDDALAAAMRQSGLGTPATRAAIIEKLIRTRYVERRRKQLHATPKGVALIDLVAPALRSPELTAAWERRLKEVEEGELPVDAFYREIVGFVRDLLPEVARGPALSPDQVAAERAERPPRGRLHGDSTRVDAADEVPGTTSAGLGSCPICGEGEVTETTRAFGCSRYREGCGFTIWKRVAGLTLTRSRVRRLIAQHRLPRLEGFTAKSGRSFGAGLRLDAAGRLVFDFEAEPETPAEEPSEATLLAEPGAPSTLGGEDGGDADDRDTRNRGSTEPSGRRGKGPRRARRSPRGEPGSADRGPRTPGSSDPATLPSIREQPPVCPKCGRGHIIEGRRGFGCNRFREGCDFVIWKRYDGLDLAEADIRALLEAGRTRPIAGREAGARSVRLRLNPLWEVVVEDVGSPEPGNQSS